MVPRAGIEPTLPRGKRILSPPRLPIPPPRHYFIVNGTEAGVKINIQAFTQRIPLYHTGLAGIKKAAGGFEPPHGGFADPCLNLLATPPEQAVHGAEDGIRTRDLFLGKEAFYR